MPVDNFFKLLYNSIYSAFTKRCNPIYCVESEEKAD